MIKYKIMETTIYCKACHSKNLEILQCQKWIENYNNQVQTINFKIICNECNEEFELNVYFQCLHDYLNFYEKYTS